MPLCLLAAEDGDFRPAVAAFVVAGVEEDVGQFVRPHPVVLCGCGEVGSREYHVGEAAEVGDDFSLVVFASAQTFVVEFVVLYAVLCVAVGFCGRGGDVEEVGSAVYGFADGVFKESEFV